MVWVIFGLILTNEASVHVVGIRIYGIGESRLLPDTETSGGKPPALHLGRPLEAELLHQRLTSCAGYLTEASARRQDFLENGADRSVQAAQKHLHVRTALDLRDQDALVLNYIYEWVFGKTALRLHPSPSPCTITFITQ